MDLLAKKKISYRTIRANRTLSEFEEEEDKEKE